MKKITISILSFIILLTGCETTTFSADSQQKRNYNEQKKEVPEIEEVEEVIQDTEDKQDNGQKEDTLMVVDDPTRTNIIVNKKQKLPDGYEPNDLIEADVSYYAAEGHPKRLLREVAANALEELFQAAKNSSMDLVAVSGYRSYDRQKQIYERNVETKGKEHANKFSAKPGTSEHQTGLAMDVASAALVAVLEQSFIETDEGKWLENHAHEHGFIIRYPKGKENITGYEYEPWHLRYVGEELATEIYQAQATLEEHFGFM